MPRAIGALISSMSPLPPSYPQPRKSTRCNRCDRWHPDVFSWANLPASDRRTQLEAKNLPAVVEEDRDRVGVAVGDRQVDLAVAIEVGDDEMRGAADGEGERIAESSVAVTRKHQDIVCAADGDRQVDGAVSVVMSSPQFETTRPRPIR